MGGSDHARCLRGDRRVAQPRYEQIGYPGAAGRSVRGTARAPPVRGRGIECPAPSRAGSFREAWCEFFRRPHEHEAKALSAHRACLSFNYVTADFSAVDPQRMMCTYGPAEGLLLNHSYMHGVCGSISSQSAVRARLQAAHVDHGGRLAHNCPLLRTTGAVGLLSVGTSTDPQGEGGAWPPAEEVVCHH